MTTRTVKLRWHRSWLAVAAVAVLVLAVAATVAPAAGAVGKAGRVTRWVGMYDPEQLVTGPDAALWIANTFGESIGRLTTDGAYTGYKSSAIHQAHGITAGPDGALWFSDENGGLIETFAGGDIGVATAIVGSPDGTVWFDTNGTVVSIDSTGTTRVIGRAFVDTFAAGSDGAVWFTGSGQLGRIATA